MGIGNLLCIGRVLNRRAHASRPSLNNWWGCLHLLQPVEVKRRGLVLGLAFVLTLSLVDPIAAHRSGCHRWHSCPSDTGSYVCGDLDHCSQCPDNQYCLGGQPRPAAQQTPQPSQPSTPHAETYLVKRVIDGDTIELSTGDRIRLEYDWERRDKYGRTLAYVYLEDGTFLNAEIIRQGYGFAYTRFPFKYLEEFRKLEQEARETGRGLWGK